MLTILTASFTGKAYMIHMSVISRRADDFYLRKRPTNEACSSSGPVVITRDKAGANTI